MSVQNDLEQIDEIVEVDIFEGGGSGFRDVTTDINALLRDVEAWTKHGPIESFEQEGDEVIVQVNQDAEKEMLGKFDQKFKNLYMCIPLGDQIKVMPH